MNRKSTERKDQQCFPAFLDLLPLPKESNKASILVFVVNVLRASLCDSSIVVILQDFVRVTDLSNSLLRLSPFL